MERGLLSEARLCDSDLEESFFLVGEGGVGEAIAYGQGQKRSDIT